MSICAKKFLIGIDFKSCLKHELLFDDLAVSTCLAHSTLLQVKNQPCTQVLFNRERRLIQAMYTDHLQIEQACKGTWGGLATDLYV